MEFVLIAFDPLNNLSKISKLFSQMLVNLIWLKYIVS